MQIGITFPDMFGILPIDATKKSFYSSLPLTDDDSWAGFWTQSIASGSKSFIEEVKKSLGFKAQGKSITAIKDHYQLRESASAFGYTPLQISWACKRSDAGRINADGWREIS